MPTSIIITHLPPPPPLVLKHPRCLSKVLSTQHSTGCLLNATRKPCYWENFISIKQLHGNSPRAQGTQAAKLPTCLSLFLGTSEWRGYPVSHLSERTESTGEQRATVNISQSPYCLPHSLTTHNALRDLKLKSSRSSLFGLKWWQQQQQQQQQSKYPEKCQLLSDWVWSDGHYNRLTSILIIGQKERQINPITWMWASSFNLSNDFICSIKITKIGKKYS